MPRCPVGVRMSGGKSGGGPVRGMRNGQQSFGRRRVATIRRALVASAGCLALLAVAATACVPDPYDPGPSTTTTSQSPSTTVPGVPIQGRPYSWGYNGFGNLGNGTLTDQPSPVAFVVPAGVEIGQVSAGGFHTLAIGSDGFTYASGRDDNGELGNDAALSYQVSPVRVATPPGVRFTQVSAGGNHSLALGDDGLTYAWGLDADGQLGNDAALINQPTPVPVAMPAGVRFVDISAGYAHSLALGDNGKLYSWGYDFYSELGNDTVHLNQPTPVPVAMPPGLQVTAIAAGGHHNLVLSSNGAAYSWGWDAFGQLGDNAAIQDRDLPTLVATPVGISFRQIAAGAHHSLAIASNGRVYSWGSDQEGELGDGVALVDQPIPVMVSLPMGTIYSQIAAGGRHSVAIGSDHLVYLWGSDGSGQMGDGLPLIDHPTPVALQLPGQDRAARISAGYYHVVAVGS